MTGTVTRLTMLRGSLLHEIGLAAGWKFGDDRDTKSNEDKLRIVVLSLTSDPVEGNPSTVVLILEMRNLVFHDNTLPLREIVTPMSVNRLFRVTIKVEEL